MVGEIGKAVGQWVVGNVGWTVIIVLFILSAIFKVAKREIDPLGLVISWIGKAFTKDVRKDIADLKSDYNEKITDLREDLDDFEERTNASIGEIKSGTTSNCTLLKLRLDKIEESNDMQTIRQIKGHVLDFANSCMNKHKHTKQDFDNIIKENEEYESLVKKYKLRNDVYAEDYNYIMKIYHRCMEEGSFLKDDTIP